MTTQGESEPARELGVTAALRDIAIGGALLTIGIITGGSSLDGHDVDRLDIFFDVLGGAWIVWGLGRLIYRAARRA